MATITETTPDHELDRLLKDRRILVIGLAWGSLVLLFFGFWFGARDRDALAVVVDLASAVALCLAVAVFVSRGGVGDPEQRLAHLRSQQRAVGMALLVAGALLLLFGAWLVFSERLQGFAEGFGLAILGFISLFTGYRLVAKPKVPLQDRIMSALGSKEKQIGLGLFIVGALCILGAVYLKAFRTKPNPLAGQPIPQVAKDDGEKTQPARISDPADFPIWAGLLLFGFIGVGSGLPLYLAKETNIRIMVLIVGGLVGLVIFLMTLAQAWLWRETIIGGLPAWRGENGWRIWLCAYLMLFGLGLMFGSFMLARTDIRINPVLRRVLYGYNAIFTGLLLLAFLGILNVVVYAKYPMTLDWSSGRGMTTISDSTRDILERLNKPATVYVLLSPRVQRLYKDVKTLLDNAQTVTDRLKVDYISPDQDFQKYNTLARRYAEILPDVKTAAEDDILGRGILVVYGPESSDLKEKPPPHAFIPSRKLFEVKGGFHRGAPQTYSFLGEKAMMTELLFLMEGQKKNKVYFLQGHDELDLKDGRPTRGGRYDLPMSFLGMDILLDRLKKENYEVQGLSFAEAGEKADKTLTYYVKAKGKEKRKDIPDDAGIVVIAGPSTQLSKEALDALGRYMEKNGRLVVFFDIIVDPKYTALKTTGLEDFLKKYNVQVGTDFIYRFPRHPSDDPTVAIAITPRDSTNPLAKRFPGTAFLLETVRVVKPGSESPNFTAETLLDVRALSHPVAKQDIFWAETSTKALINPLKFARDMEEDQVLAKRSQQPIPIAVAVKDKEDRPRLVVYGDAEMASNLPIFGRFRNIPVGESYFNLFVSTLDYLTDRPGVGARPKESKLYTLDNTVPTTPLAYLPAWLMSLSIFGLGLGMWVVRRR